MYQLLAVLACAAGLILAFVSPVWAWTPLALGTAVLYWTFFAVRTRKHGPVSELSPAANDLLLKFGHFYAMPFAGRDVSAAASTIALGAIVVSVVAGFRGFWWGLAIGVVLYLLVTPLGRQFNPTNFLANDVERAAHQEIVEFLTRRGEKTT